MHLGDAEWVVVDSCLHPDTGEPAALNYLWSLGVDPSNEVRLVVVTHWDDDHIAGLARVVDVCHAARIVCSAALNRREIVSFVIAVEGTGGASGTGVDELRAVLRLGPDRGGIIWAKATQPLHPLPPGDQPSVVALSPSEDAFERSLTKLIEEATGKRSVVSRRYTAPDEPNSASVAASVRRGGIAALLGADLETTKNAKTGWDAVIAYARPSTPASVVKVPHHGSEDAHHDGIWTELAESDAIAVVTPWVKGGKKLPKETDIARLATITPNVYVTADPGLRRVRDSLLRRVHEAPLHELRGWGHVRARRQLDEGAWRVELDGDAWRVERESA